MSTYADIPADKKAPALALLREVTIPVLADARLHGTPYGEGWWREKKQVLIGIALRHLLRSRGFDEAYFGVQKLDEIYDSLMEDAHRIEDTGYSPESLKVLEGMTKNSHQN